jgi:uncharacterized surface protein with fasciclin (FAS1) repeats
MAFHSPNPKKTNHKVMKPIVLLTPIIAFTATTGTLFAEHHETTNKPSEVAVAETKNIVTIASEAEDFATLVAAIKSAGLAEKLSGKGPFTVFAPTNEAFKAVPAKTLEALGKDPVALKSVLTYHVVPAKAMAANVKNGKVKTVNGADIELGKAGDFVTVGEGAIVTKADMVASNGVVHVIDAVLLPPKKK